MFNVLKCNLKALTTKSANYCFFSVTGACFCVLFVGALGWVAALWQPWGHYSVLGLAVKSGSPWTFQAPNLH